MKRIFGKRFFALVIAVTVAVATTQITEAQELPCISALAGCADFYNNTSLTPNEKCCGPLANALKTVIPCICSIFSNSSLQKELGITLQIGLELCDRCNITATASLNLCTSAAPASAPKNDPAFAPENAPASTPKNAPASPPKNAPGMAPPSPSGGTFRAEWIGFSTFFSFLLIIMA